MAWLVGYKESYKVNKYKHRNKLQSRVTNVGDKSNISSWQGSNSTITVAFDVHVTAVWCLSSVPNVVQICVIYVPDCRLITSRKLTSRSNFWSRDHLRMATMHILNKIRCRYLHPILQYRHFSKFNIAAAAAWIFTISQFTAFRHDDCVVLQLFQKNNP